MSQMDNMFIDACKNGQKGVAQTLLAKGDVDVNKRDAMGYTALHYACQKGPATWSPCFLGRARTPAPAPTTASPPCTCAPATATRTSYACSSRPVPISTPRTATAGPR